MLKIKNYADYEKTAVSAAEDFNNQQFEKALGKFLQLAEFNPDNYKVHETLCIIYLKLDKADDAHKEFDLAVRLMQKNGKNVILPKSFEEAVAELGNIDNLKKEYEESLSSDKSATLLPIQISMHYMSKGEYKAAEDLLIKHKEMLANQNKEKFNET